MPTRVPALEDDRPARAGAPHNAMPHPLDVVTEALARMRFGVIQLTVHDGRLVQVDVTERSRFA